MRAIGTFDDGTIEDVTALTTFSSNDEGIATVTPDGAVSVHRTGDTAVIAQYSGGVASTQILVPSTSSNVPFPAFPCNNQIDTLVSAKLHKLNVHPSQLCSDEDFLRRVYLDVIGTLPTPEAARSFLADRDPEKKVAADQRFIRPTRIRALLGNEVFGLDGQQQVTFR